MQNDDSSILMLVSWDQNSPSVLKGLREYEDHNLCTRIVKVHKIHYLFATAHTRAGCVKPAQSVEPKY